jgi:exosortase
MIDPESTRRVMSRRVVAGTVAVIAAFGSTYAGTTYAGTIVGLIRQWATDSDYSHGFAIAPLALFFIWRRRDDLRRATPQPTWWGLVALAASLAVLTVGRAAGDLFLPRVSLVAAIASSVLFLGGFARFRMLAFPLAFLLLMVPLPAIVFNQVAFPLQQLASSAGETALRAGGVPVLRNGNVLELSTMRLEVAEACSGIRSLMTLLTIALVISQTGAGSWRRTCLLVLATAPVAIVANAARVVATGFAAEHWGAASVGETQHALAGALVFAVALLGLLGIDRILSAPDLTGAST